MIKTKLLNPDTILLTVEGDLTAGDFWKLLLDDPRFRFTFSAALNAAPMSAFFLEMAPLTQSSQRAFELVLLQAPELVGMPADPRSFSKQLKSPGTSPFVDFPNLSGDAHLIVPKPLANQTRGYAHLREFIAGHAEQAAEFWHYAAGVVLGRLDKQPVWVSTSGLGVAWVHLRMDRRPKYYRYRAYTTI